MSRDAINGLEPKTVWERFYEITRVPRPSKKEEKIRQYLADFAVKAGLNYRVDKAGSILILVPGSPGKENAPVTVLQAHMDMVCEKDKSARINFEEDPLEIHRDGDWIAATGTTLGADDGIGVAAALAIATDSDSVHGPLELFFTVDEETGLTGANCLEKDFISGNYLLNLDSEDDGIFYVGCAGGLDTEGIYDIVRVQCPEGLKPFSVLVHGLKGGHSGMEINSGRANALKLLARFLYEIQDLSYSIGSIYGGSKRNAIPREAEAILLIRQEDLAALRLKAEKITSDLRDQYKKTDPDLEIVIGQTDAEMKEVFSPEFGRNILRALMAMPHGVQAMSPEIAGLVETSTNLATLSIGDKLIIGTSQRSSIESAKTGIAEEVASVIELSGGKVHFSDGYSGWQANLSAELLSIAKSVFVELFGHQAELKAIHAGLECGIFKSKLPELEMLSFGPTVKGAHSPEERVSIETVSRFYCLIKGILQKISEQL